MVGMATRKKRQLSHPTRKRQKEKLMFFFDFLFSKKLFYIFIILFSVIENLYSQSILSPIPLSSLPDKNKEISYTYSIVGKSKSVTSIVSILSENNFIENSNSDYIIELSFIGISSYDLE